MFLCGSGLWERAQTGGTLDVPEPAPWSPLVDLSVLQCQRTTFGLGWSKGLVDVEESRWARTWSYRAIFFPAACVLPCVLRSVCVSCCLRKFE